MTTDRLAQLAMAAACVLAAGTANAKTPSDVLVMARDLSAISTFDPAQIGEVVTDEIILNTCDRLVDYDPKDQTKVVPSVAKSWEVSEDGLTLTFHLVEGAKFPSGNPVTAEDAAWSIKRVLKLGFGNAATLKEYGFSADKADEQIVATDPHTLQLHLTKPYPALLILQAIAANRVAAVLDKKKIMENAVGDDYGNRYLTTHTACVGPYHLRQWAAGDVVVLEANDNYYGAKPHMKRWIIRNVSEAGAQQLLLEKGDIDVARDLGEENLRAIDKESGLRVETTLKQQMFYMGFNEQEPRFADPRVRLAFKYLIDYDALGKTVLAYAGVPRADVVPLGAYGALDKAEGQPFSLNIDKAKALLKEAGYGDGFTAKLYIGSGPTSGPIAQHVQENAKKVGIDLKIERMADAQLFSAFRGRDFDTVMLSWSTSVPHAHGMLSRHAVNPDNSAKAKLTMYPTWRASWYNPDFNKRVEQALFEKDPKKQLAMYRQLQLDHMQTGPFAYIYQTYDTAGVSDVVTNWPWNAFRVYYDDVTKKE